MPPHLSGPRMLSALRDPACFPRDPRYLPLAGAAGAAGAGAAAFGFGADFLTTFAGRLLPNEPLNIFPFFVFLSPLPIIVIF
jgi:hypothetical protein